MDLIDLISQGIIDEVREEIANGCDVDEKDYVGCCAVLKCVERNDSDILEILIEANANLEVKDPLGNSALSCAKRYGHDKIVTMIENALAKSKLVEPTAKEQLLSLKGGLCFYDKSVGMHEDEQKSGKHDDELKEGPFSPTPGKGIQSGG